MPYTIKVDFGYGRKKYYRDQYSIQRLVNHLDRKGKNWRLIEVFTSYGVYLTRYTRNQRQYIPDKYHTWF
jgi:hypothetical protein